MSRVDFTPIGKFYDNDNTTVTENAVFSGNYNGDKHKITNLKIKSYYKYCGLFGRIGESGDTENACKIHHLAVYGTITSSNSIVGGIAGEVGYGASVVNCCFHGIVTGTDYVGEIVGRIYEGGNINYSYFNGDVQSNGLCAGIVSKIDIGNTTKSCSSEINSCYSNGNLSGTTVYAILSDYDNHSSSESTVELTNNYYSINSASLVLRMI